MSISTFFFKWIQSVKKKEKEKKSGIFIWKDVKLSGRKYERHQKSLTGTNPR